MEDSRIASELLRMEGITSTPARAAMATYYSPKGKAYAWQITFSLDRWERVARKLGISPVEAPARAKAKKSPRQNVIKDRKKPAARSSRASKSSR